jgi:hypothetical protein
MDKPVASRIQTLEQHYGWNELEAMYSKAKSPKRVAPEWKPRKKRVARAKVTINPNKARVESAPIERTFEYDPETGKISRVGLDVAVEMMDTHGYLYVRYGRVAVASHRLGWLLTTGEWPDGRIKWINGVVTDNRWENLRVGANMDKRYQAQVMINGRRVSLGYYETPIERDMVAMHYKLTGEKPIKRTLQTPQ